jgi:hypothetical protein
MEHMLFAPISVADPAMAASSVATAQWWPAGCATREKDKSNPDVVHIHLNDCTGPFGLRHHTGDITVTFSKNADGTLHAQASSANMTVNGNPSTFSRDSDISIAGASRTVKTTGAWTRVNAKGETVSHTTDTTTIVDTSAKCRTTSGTAQTNVGKREVDSTITDYKVCRAADGSDECPTGEITHTRTNSGETITISFDGSADATETGAKSGTEQLPLVCTPAN